MMKIISSSRASILLWIMALFAIVGCSDWIDTPTTSNPNSMEHAPTIVTDAQRLLEQRGEFFLLNMSLRDGKVREKSKATATSSKNLRVRWDKYHLFKDRGEEVVTIPIEGYHLTALSVLSIDGRSKKAKNRVTSKLIVRRDENKMLVAVIGTYIYDQNYARDYQAELDTLGYDFENSHFTGYFITSRLDGQLLLGRSLKKGTESFAFRLNPHPEKADEEQPIHLHLDLNSQTPMTRSAFAEQENGEGGTCVDCGRSKDDCGCVVVIYCQKCHKQQKEGKCGCDDQKCNVCLFPIKGCNCCKTCKEPKTFCRCNTNSGNPAENGENKTNDGSKNGSYNGGNSSNQDGHHGGNYGGYYDSGSSFGGGSGYKQEYNHLLFVNKPYFIAPEKIKNIAKNTVVRFQASQYIDAKGKFIAVCNLGVQYHFQQTFPNHHPPGMSGRANDMVRAWRNGKGHWVRIKGGSLKETLQEVMETVNAGLYVVAGWENPNKNESGHVVVILPGTGNYNKHWRVEMPPMMDTGVGRRGTHYYLDDGFGKSKIPNVEFYYYAN